MHFLGTPTLLLRACELLTSSCHDANLVAFLNHDGRWLVSLLHRRLVLRGLQRRLGHELPRGHGYLLGSVLHLSLHLIFRHSEDLVRDTLELVYL